MPYSMQTQLLLSLAFSPARSNSEEAFGDFASYVTSFGRDYAEGSHEFTKRQGLFQQRLQLIAAQNARETRRWTAGVNHFTDRTADELAQFKGWRHVAKGSHRSNAPVLLAEASQILKTAPAGHVDWTSLSMAEKVPDQGGCGSCWAVATKAMLDGRYEAQRNQSRSFSAQQLVNCVPNPQECGGSGGCEGATVELAMDYIDQVGLQDDSSVPYVGADEHCNHPLPAPSFLQHHRRKHSGGSTIGLSNWHKLPENHALPLMHAVMSGPVAVSVAASPWFSYSGGVFDGCERDAVIDHAVVLFGYGDEGDAKYWKIRNSWGRLWGESGFLRLLRHATPEEDEAFCGSDNNPGAGLACKPYPDAVTVCGMCGILYDSVAANFAQ